MFSFKRSWMLLWWALIPALATATLFSKPRPFDVGTSPIAVSIADFNHDGMADLAVCDGVANTVSILIGNGDGSFKPAVDYPSGQGTTIFSIAIGDFNEDGNPDVVTTVSLTGLKGGSFAVLEGNGDGTFAPAVFTPSGISPIAIAVADLNEDGHQDLFLGGNGSSAVYLGRGDGTFNPPQFLPFSATLSAVAIGDLNGDGTSDLVGTDEVYGTMLVLLGNGDGTFQNPASFPVLECPGSVALGDVNGDGNLDAVVANYLSNAVSVLLGNGDGTFQSQRFYFAGFYELSTVLADLNGDHKLDIIVGAYRSPTSKFAAISVLLGKGDGTFSPAVFFPAGPDEWAVAVGQLNRDKRPDVVVTSPFSNTVDVLLNTYR